MAAPGELIALGAFGVAAGTTFALTPPARRLAVRAGLLDHPVGYKAHGTPTPYLGGAAVLVGVLVAVLVMHGLGGHLGAVAAVAAALWLLGTADDRFFVAPGWRLLAEVAAAVVLDAAGAGWTVLHSDAANLVLTVLWVVGLVNAFNLMDNLDGATGTVAGTSAVWLASLALVWHATAAAVLAAALAGACAGFLPRNLARPSRIFLGDGGSMPIGLLVAASAMLAFQHVPLGAAGAVAAALLVALPIFDVTLVVISRRRRGVSILTGGRDHLTHRVLARVGTPRRVALTLAVLQSGLAALALAGTKLGGAWVLAFGLAAAAAGAVALVRLEEITAAPRRSAVLAPVSQDSLPEAP